MPTLWEVGCYRSPVSIPFPQCAFLALSIKKWSVFPSPSMGAVLLDNRM